MTRITCITCCYDDSYRRNSRPLAVVEMQGRHDREPSRTSIQVATLGPFHSHKNAITERIIAPFPTWPTLNSEEPVKPLE